MHVAGSAVMTLSLLVVLHALCGTVFVGADAGQRSQPAYDEDFSGKVANNSSSHTVAAHPEHVVQRTGKTSIKIHHGRHQRPDRKDAGHRASTSGTTDGVLRDVAKVAKSETKARGRVSATDTRDEVVPDAPKHGYLFTVAVMAGMAAFLVVCMGLVSWGSSEASPGSDGVFLSALDEPSIKNGFLSNMPSVGFTHGYLACWIFPLWIIVQLGWWGLVTHKSCDMEGQAWPNSASAEQPISWLTCIALFVSIAASAMAVQTGMSQKDADSEASASERSVLLDNAKIGAMICIIFGRIVFYNTDREYRAYHDYLTWFSGETTSGYVMSITEFSINSACFLSGCVMRRPVNVTRFFNLVFDLILPCFLWTYILKGFMKANFENSSWTFSTLTSSLVNIFDLSNYQDEWYLQALIVWRMFSYFTGMLNVPIVFAISCMLGGMAGYNTHATSGYNFDTAFGFLLMFTMGMLCPLQKLTAKIPSNWILQTVGVGVIALFPLAIGPLGPLPDNNLPFTLMDGAADHYNALKLAATDGSCLAEYNLFWTRRVLKNVLALVPVLAYVVLLVPRQRTFLSELGPHTLYPYLFHEFFNFGRDRLVMALHLPISTSAFVHLLFYATSLGWSTLVFCICASRPFRFIFSRFFDFSWLKAYVLPRTDGQIDDPEHAIDQRATGADHCLRRSISPPCVDVEALHDMDAVQPPSPRATDGDWTLFTDPWRALDEDRPFIQLPPQRSAEKFYKLMFFVGLGIGSAYYLIVGCYILPNFVERFDGMNDFVWTKHDTLAKWVRALAIWGFASLLLYRAVFQFLRMRRLSQGLGPTPALSRPSGLLHYIVICTYKEPVPILRMTLGSLAKQTWDPKSLHILLATESRDPTAQASFDQMQVEFGAIFGSMMMTVHTLREGEIAGKSSNENYAVRELYKKLAPMHNPYRVMLTIADVDSLFAQRFIEQLDWTFQRYPNPGQLLYDSPINTYRNYWEANMFIRTHESDRCQEAVSKIWQFQSCQSNYSLTLGFAHEINFWCPDNTPEDFHTTMKTFVHTHGSHTVVPVFSIISNDLVVGWSDRYVQAKRHGWGVTESMWILASYRQIQNRLIWANMLAFICYDQVGKPILQAAQLLLLLSPGFWHFIFHIKPLSRYILIGAYLIRSVYMWIEYIAIDAWTFFKILPCDESEYLTSLTLKHKAQFVLQWLLYPVLSLVGSLAFQIVPRMHCLIHSAFISPQLAYVCAPKALNSSKDVCKKDGYKDTVEACDSPLLSDTLRHGTS